ncbi:hypothetical protein D3C79_797400 [compost metagenome]
MNRKYCIGGWASCTKEDSWYIMAITTCTGVPQRSFILSAALCHSGFSVNIWHRFSGWAGGLVLQAVRPTRRPAATIKRVHISKMPSWFS